MVYLNNQDDPAQNEKGTDRNSDQSPVKMSNKFFC